MTDRATKRKAIADKLAAAIPRLRADIAKRRVRMELAKVTTLAAPVRGKLAAGWFSSWEKHAFTIARLEGSLARALKREPVARTIAEEIAHREREKAHAKQRRDAMTRSLNKRFDRLNEMAPHPQAHWDAEREAEAKRIKKMKRALERRTSKDKSPRWSITEKPLKLPDPIQQPDLSEEEEATPPPREGLIPGTYRMVDPARLASLLDPDPLPPTWTAEHVGKRLIEAHAVLNRVPMKLAPAGYGAMWPAYRHEAGELAHQAGAGTLAIGRNVIVRTASADEVARMNEALQWPMQFLGATPHAAEYVNWWASHSEPQEEDRPTSYLQIIADALNAAKEVVR